MNAWRTLAFVTLVSASTPWAAIAASAPTASKWRGTIPCVLVRRSDSRCSVLTSRWLRSGTSTVLFWFQMWMSVKSSLVATGPARTRWALTTACATPDFRTRTTATALVCAPGNMGVKVGMLHVALCICVLVRRGRVCRTEGLVSKRAVFEHYRQFPLRM